MTNQFAVETKMMEVAKRIRALRDAVGMTQAEMASKTGVSVEEYERLEMGKTDFPFSFIYKMALACNVEITDIMEGSSPILSEYTLTRKGEGMPIARKAGFSYENLAPLFKNKLAEPFFVRVPYSKAAENGELHLSTHKGQEMDIVIKGTLRVTIGDRQEVLHEGDCIYYDSSVPHDECALNGEACEFYAVVMNPDMSGIPAPIENMVVAQTNVDKAGLVNPVYERFIDTECDMNGVLSKISFKNEENFNFAFDVVDAVAEKDPNRLAMLHLSHDKEERRFTFAQMSELSSRAANYFESVGIRKGDRVMLVLRRNYQFWIAILGLHKLGAIAIPATDLLTKHDFEYRFNAAGVSAIVCTSYGYSTKQVDEAAPESPTLRYKIVANGNAEGWLNFDEGIANASPVYERRADAPGGDDIMLMFFTSGTTGYPKIAMHNFRYPLGHFITAKYWHNVDPDGIHFTVADTGWGKALWGKLYGQWLCEAATFTYDFDKFDPADMLPLFAKYNITTFCAPPTIYRFLIKEDLSKFDLSSIKYATTAGEALNPEVYVQFLKATGIHIMEGFGQTETTLSICNPVGSFNKPGSMGTPSPLFDVQLLLPDGTPTKNGEVGEIVIKTADSVPTGLFAGYYNDKERTEEVWHDGYYHTGDTAWMDEDGFFWYVGRVDDVIKSSGYRIGPFEIESVLMELPYILECAVTGAPDPVRGQVVKASIVLTKGTEGSDELKKEIQNYVKTHTAPYKYPRIIEFMDALPKTISGKIRRSEIRQKDNQ